MDDLRGQCPPHLPRGARALPGGSDVISRRRRCWPGQAGSTKRQGPTFRVTQYRCHNHPGPQSLGASAPLFEVPTALVRYSLVVARRLLAGIAIGLTAALITLALSWGGYF